MVPFLLTYCATLVVIGVLFIIASRPRKETEKEQLARVKREQPHENLALTHYGRMDGAAPFGRPAPYRMGGHEKYRLPEDAPIRRHNANGKRYW